MRDRRRLCVRGGLPDEVRPVRETVQGGATPAKPGQGVRRLEGLPLARGAVRAEGGAGEAAVRLYGSEWQRRADEHGALAYPQQPESAAVETDLAHQGLVTRGGRAGAITPLASSGSQVFKCCDLGIANLSNGCVSAEAIPL